MISSIQEVSYKGDYKINFRFSDGIERTIIDKVPEIKEVRIIEEV